MIVRVKIHKTKRKPVGNLLLLMAGRLFRHAVLMDLPDGNIFHRIFDVRRL